LLLHSHTEQVKLKDISLHKNHTKYISPAKAGITRADIVSQHLATNTVSRQGGPTADNKEYSSLHHYHIIAHYRLLQ